MVFLRRVFVETPSARISSSPQLEVVSVETLRRTTLTRWSAARSNPVMTSIRAHRVRDLLKLTRRVWEARHSAEHDVRAELVASLAQLIGAPAGILVQDTQFIRGGGGPMSAVTPFNVETLFPAVMAVIERRTSMPLFAALIDRVDGAGQTVALARGDSIDAASWERHPFVDAFIRPAGFDDCLASVKTGQAPGHVLGFNFLRERGDAPFTEEDRALLELFTSEVVDLLHPTPLAERWKLTRREAAVLDALLRGESNKELASRFDCSLRTIETHVASILRKANVPSRAKLIILASQGL